MWCLNTFFWLKTTWSSIILSGAVANESPWITICRIQLTTISSPQPLGYYQRLQLENKLQICPWRLFCTITAKWLPIPHFGNSHSLPNTLHLFASWITINALDKFMYLFMYLTNYEQLRNSIMGYYWVPGVCIWIYLNQKYTWKTHWYFPGIFQHPKYSWDFSAGKK